MVREGLRALYTLRAARELRAHATYYESRTPGLGHEFRTRVRDAEELARSNPTGFRIVAESPLIRAIAIRRFPFQMLYSLRGDAIVIIAVAHTAREPDDFMAR